MGFEFQWGEDEEPSLQSAVFQALRAPGEAKEIGDALLGLIESRLQPLIEATEELLEDIDNSWCPHVKDTGGTMWCDLAESSVHRLKADLKKARAETTSTIFKLETVSLRLQTEQERSSALREKVADLEWELENQEPAPSRPVGE